MEHQETRVEIFEKFTWKIDNFSHLNVENIRSEPFVLGGYPWRILLYPRGNKVNDSLSIYLEAMQTANMSKGWSRDVKFKLLLFNQLNTNITITEESRNEFNAGEVTWGFKSLKSLAELHDPNMGFIVKDACIVGAEIFVCKSAHEKLINQVTNLTAIQTFGSQKSHMEVEALRPEPDGKGTNLGTISLVCNEPTKHTDAELFSPSIEELMDFCSLGQREEILWSGHPSHSECQPKRSCKSTDLAFAALGRVIYFLKTLKMKDMNEQACKDLQILWEELEKFRFDLTWLEPDVQFALGVKSYVEKALEVEKLKENVVALELETERLKTKLVTAEVNLCIERDFLKAKGFKEKDLDSELGCGS
ncbi:MATH domain and coiled-coil domain-containing protein At3g58210-like [Cicer arietinum]|uniref:MATH domain and coiled-coil domain-containing protein At3g58210-like n=1 Tax=Cicer arietinum TaxID=3827 RepID=UPI00032A5A56